ncbi:alpha/beta fold hydrolase [Paraburkholderia phenoliruptrix]|uniref:Aminoacrylate hydrolase RutD n=2 Tax=Paraburkholderia phenoliruptrix TaxID=252970 RepID=A0A6J5KG16_9BURK|nr:alpha/beta hydrolase [Paraburkholderia phenoliruptrix]AFT90295.1 Putative hydrolase [Paraburkholderia phenoliruptrix BR3459a]CAB4051714.1 Putative aminoacrylate hydrolase RutD [Paraburkholderia phenoliruptrix]
MKSFVTDAGVAGSITAGNGPAILLISGLGGRGSFWHQVMEILSPTFRTITFDHPGVGESKRVGQQSIPNVVTAALDVLDTLEIDRATIVGHSTGSLVAQAIALEFPRRCRQLVLSGGWARPDRRFRDCFVLRKQVLVKAGSVAYGLLSDLLAYPNAWYNNAIAQPQQPAFDGAQQTDAEIEIVADRIDMLLKYSRIDELHKVDLRTLVIGALDDIVVPIEHSRELASLIPGSLLVEMNGGHFFPKVETEQYARYLIEFMGES